MTQKTSIIVFLLSLAFALSACGLGLDADDAEDALDAAFSGDVEAANETFCDAQQLAEATELPEGVAFAGAECSEDGGEMICELRFEPDDTAEADIDAASFNVIFQIENDKLCDFRIPN